MALRFYNKNIIGIHYGGNLFSMTDPCFMMMLMRNMGNNYKVIDQSGAIEFIKPGRGTVTANCYLLQEDVDDIIMATKSGDKYFKNFSIDIVDEQSEVIARVKRSIYIRKRL